MIFPNQLLLFLLSSALFYFFFYFFLKPQESLGEQMGVIKMTHSHINKAKKKQNRIPVLQSSKTDTAKSLMF